MHGSFKVGMVNYAPSSTIKSSERSVKSASVYIKATVISLIICSAATALPLAPTTEKKAAVYRIETLLFALDENKHYSSEFWRLELPESHPYQLQKNQQHAYLSGEKKSPTYKTKRAKTTRISAKNFHFKNIAQRLRNSGGYRILYHKAWQQSLVAKNASLSIPVKGGNAIGDYSELEGDITISLSRYLHIDTNLWLTDYRSELDIAKLLRLPSEAPRSEEIFAPYYSVHMHESRRMRSKEIHYLDHPLFGLIIKITPVNNG